MAKRTSAKHPRSAYTAGAAPSNDTTAPVKVRLTGLERPRRLPKVSDQTWRAAKGLYDAHCLMGELVWGESFRLSYVSLASASTALQALLSAPVDTALQRRLARQVLADLKFAETMARKAHRSRRAHGLA